MPRHPQVYIAALFGEIAKARELADWLKSRDVNVQASWVYGGEEGKTLEEIALLDMWEVVTCNAVVALTLPKGSAVTGGGRHFELGAAFAWDKRMIILGPREIIFHHLPTVEQVDTREEVLNLLLGATHGKR